MTFLRAVRGFTFDATGFTLLQVDAPPLTRTDAERPLLVLDSTWRWLPELERCIGGDPLQRSLPTVPTAYPRQSRTYKDPERGMASVEAIYLAKRILGDDDPSLLDGYYWKDQFLTNVRTAYGLFAV